MNNSRELENSLESDLKTTENHCKSFLRIKYTIKFEKMNSLSKTLNISMHIRTIMKSKEDQILEPFFNSPKHWHFEELKKQSRLSRSRLAEWLKRFENQGIIKKIKEKNKMPYYIQNYNSKTFQNKKRLFALKQLTESGFLDHLGSLEKAKVIILFGSLSRYDWHKDSDIDIFIYGKDDFLLQGKFETLLKREIQIHLAKDKHDLNKLNKMLPYIIEGDFIKGSIQDLDVIINAKA